MRAMSLLVATARGELVAEAGGPALLFSPGADDVGHGNAGGLDARGSRARPSEIGALARTGMSQLAPPSAPAPLQHVASAREDHRRVPEAG